MERRAVAAGEGLHGGGAARRRMAIGMAISVPEHQTGAACHRRGLVEVGLQLGQHAAARRGHLRLGEGGLEDHLQEGVERGRGELERHREPERGLVGRGGDAEVRAHPLDEVVHAVRVAAGGAAAEQIAGEAGEPGLARGVARGARWKRESRVEQRHAAPLDGDQRQPRLLTDDRVRRQRDVLQRRRQRRAHAAPPTCCCAAWARCASMAGSRSAGSVSGWSPGISVTTLRRWGAKVSNAARRSSSAVSDR